MHNTAGHAVTGNKLRVAQISANTSQSEAWAVLGILFHSAGTSWLEATKLLLLQHSRNQKHRNVKILVLLGSHKKDVLDRHGVKQKTVFLFFEHKHIFFTFSLTQKTDSLLFNACYKTFHAETEWVNKIHLIVRKSRTETAQILTAKFTN